MGKRKLFTRMVFGILISLLLVCMLAPAFTLNWSTQSSLKSFAVEEILPTDKPSVFFHNGTVYNEPFIAKVNDTITIALVIFNLTKDLETGNLTGFDIQFSWDPTVLKYVNYTNPDPEIGGYRHPNVTVPVEKYPDPVPPSPYAGILHEEIFEIKNVVNESASIPGAEPGTMAWFAYGPLGAEPFSGNGTFFTMTFKVLKSGSSPLKLTKVDLSGEEMPPVHLSYQAFDGVFKTAEAPTAKFTFWPSVGVENKSVIFNASASYDPDGYVAKYIWDFGDGNITTVTTPIVSHSYNDTGPYIVSLTVVDNDGLSSSPKTEEVWVVEKRNVKVIGVLLTPAHVVLVNRTVDIEVTVVNHGWADENCTVRAYYNATAVNETDISATDWILIGEENVSLPSGGGAIKHFTWNTTGVSQVEAYYYVLVNTTLVPYEENVTDNARISSDPIFVTEEELHDVAVKKLEFGWGEVFATPVLDGEYTTFQVTVLNNGTEDETAINVTLYCNGSVMKSWTESLAYGQTIEFTWQELLDPDYYNITALATIENDEHPDDNRKEGILHVIRTPQLNFSYSPKWVLLNQTVFLDASASFHGEPGASITEYKWQIFDPGGTLVKTLSGSDLVNMTYQFGEEGEWRVVLSVTDSYNIEYYRFRPATGAYIIQDIIDVKEGSTYCFEAGTWNDVTYYINITSNSTVIDFYFNPDATPPFIEFNVTGTYGKGVCQVAIPKALLWVEDGWKIYVEGQATNYTMIQDENTTYVYFTYNHCPKMVRIEGTHVIPEFPLTITLLLAMVSITIVVLIAKKNFLEKQRLL